MRAFVRAGSCFVALCLLAAPVVAQDAEADRATGPPDLAATLKSVNDAIKKGDLAGAHAAFDAALAFKDGDARDLKRLAQAIGRGVKHRDPQVAIASMNALGKLGVPGSSKLLGKYLRPPARLDTAHDEAVPYLRAVEVAGEIHDAPALRQLESLLKHRRLEVGERAAKALAHYRDLEPKERVDLIKRLVKVLGDFEKKLSRAGVDDDARHRMQRVRVFLISSLGKIARYQAATTSSDWNNWLRSEGKRLRSSG